MKKTQLIIGMASLLMAASPAFALPRSQVKEIHASLSTIAVPELPAAAVSLVRAAQKKDREEVAVTAVRAIVAKHRAAGPVVVAAISKELPELSAAAAKAAISAAPETRETVAAVAIEAAPSQSLAITSASGFSHASAPAALDQPGVRSAGNGQGNNGNGNGNGGPSHGNIRVKDKPIKYQGAHPKPPKNKPNKKNGPRNH